MRKLPGSRRYPHFDQAALGPSLQAEGISYHHFPDFGGRRKPQPDSRNTAWRHPAFRAYADYMETPEFAGAIERLTALAGEKRTAIMCAEAVWWRCHRSLVADYLKARGWCVLHILDAQKTSQELSLHQRGEDCPWRAFLRTTVTGFGSATVRSGCLHASKPRRPHSFCLTWLRGFLDAAEPTEIWFDDNIFAED